MELADQPPVVSKGLQNAEVIRGVPGLVTLKLWNFENAGTLTRFGVLENLIRILFGMLSGADRKESGLWGSFESCLWQRGWQLLNRC